MNILVTGVAGFIGFHVAAALLARGDSVVGLDALTTYYDPQLKQARLAALQRCATETGSRFHFIHGDLAQDDVVQACFAGQAFDRVIHLAAQAGVRYSMEAPHAYVQSNLVGFAHLIERCRQAEVPHLTYASSSSVYGASTRMPFAEQDAAAHPLQLYAATKRSNELMAHAYSHLYRLPTTGLRFFTVYGPWGRPDMALFSFTRRMLNGEAIPLFGEGLLTRDFTYIDDIVRGIVAASDQLAAPEPGWDSAQADPGSSTAPWKLYNLGNNQPVSVLTYVRALEQALGIQAKIEYLPARPEDLPHTQADLARVEAALGYRAGIRVEEGVRRFVEWYRNYYGEASA